jgi:hypothetical protein
MLQLLQCVLRSRIDISVPGVAVDEEVRLAGMAIKGDGTVLPRKSGSSVIRNGDAAQDPFHGDGPERVDQGMVAEGAGGSRCRGDRTRRAKQGVL